MPTAVDAERQRPLGGAGRPQIGADGERGGTSMRVMGLPGAAERARGEVVAERPARNGSGPVQGDMEPRAAGGGVRRGEEGADMAAGQQRRGVQGDERGKDVRLRSVCRGRREAPHALGAGCRGALCRRWGRRVPVGALQRALPARGQPHFRAVAPHHCGGALPAVLGPTQQRVPPRCANATGGVFPREARGEKRRPRQGVGGACVAAAAAARSALWGGARAQDM